MAGVPPRQRRRYAPRALSLLGSASVPKPEADPLDVVVTVLLLAAIGLLVAAFGTGHAGLAWGSVAMSAVVAALIITRWRQSWRQRQDTLGDEPSSVSAEGDAQLGDIPADDADPGEEDTDAADLLVVYELAQDVLVIDEHPRYHLANCLCCDQLSAERVPVREARELGFTPCGRCRPDTTLARNYRAARATITRGV